MSPAVDAKLEAKLQALTERADELARQLAAPELAADLERYRSLRRAYAELVPIVEAFAAYRRVGAELAGADELERTADDAELRELAGAETRRLTAEREALRHRLELLLLPSDPHDAKNVVLEIRAGTGGDEAGLFAAEIYRMYVRFAETQGWKVQETDRAESALGGVKEVIAVVEGERAYSRLKYESGVHRVQRVPATEAQGRVHTSTVTVAVLPEADEVEVKLDEKELRIDNFCASGAGGQHVNRTMSAVRITHLPTDIVVQCQDERSWHKNKARALQVLRTRLYDKMLREQQEAIARDRRGQVGSGDRSEKIRTYNFPQSRITDHRIGVSLHNIDEVMDGEIGPLLDALAAHDQEQRLRQEIAS